MGDFVFFPEGVDFLSSFEAEIVLRDQVLVGGFVHLNVVHVPDGLQLLLGLAVVGDLQRVPKDASQFVCEDFPQSLLDVLGRQFLFIRNLVGFENGLE